MPDINNPLPNVAFTPRLPGPTMPLPTLPTSTLLKGRYQLLERVGRGGMGQVYRALETEFQRIVAIKKFAPTQDDLDESVLEELQTAFRREARLLENLRHSSLPVVYGAFEENDTLYLVMDFIDGDDLGKQAKELKEKYDGQFSVAKVRGWAKDLLEVLIYLHERESPIFHRDIKPGNLKMRDGRLCLLDFGLAVGSVGKMSSVAHRTMHGYTAAFAPVEQIRGEKTTPQTDLYALGATLYYLLTGEEPTDGWRRETALRSQGQDPLKPIRQVRPEVDSVFAAAIMQALAIEAKDRPTSARAMLARLNGQTHEPKSNDTDPNPSDTRPLTPFSEAGRFEPLPPPMPVTPTPKPVPPPNPSAGRKILTAAAGLLVMCLVLTGLFLLAQRLFAPGPTPPDTDKPSVNSNLRKVIAAQDLFARPSPGAGQVGRVPANTKVQINDERQQGRDLWYQVKLPNSALEGWINCGASEASCLAP